MQSQNLPRSSQQNRLYHELVGQIHKLSSLKVYDGRFELGGYHNPIELRPCGFSYDSFKNLMKQLDLEYLKDDRGIAVSSTKLSKEEINKHILFLEVLLMDR